MKKLRFLVSVLLLCCAASMSFGDSMFFDAPNGAGTNPANWTEPSAWMDYNGSGGPFNRVPTASDHVFMLTWSSDPADDICIVNSDVAATGLWVGYWGCAATLNIEDGANLAITNQSTIGQGGAAVVTQNGGTFESTGVRIGGGNNATITLNGGLMKANGGGFVVGDSSSGTVTMTQTGGTLTTNGFAVGKEGSTGIYNMTGGTLDGIAYGGNFQIGGTTGTAPVKAEFNLGDAVSTGTIQMSKDASMLIGSKNALLRGWGTFDLDGAGSNAARLWNDGTVKADGYGIDRDLDLSQFHHVETYYAPNTGTNGWYAENHGRLLLPAVAVAAGNGSYCWGDDSYFDLNYEETNLINSFRVVFTGASEGQLVAKLLADDRSDVAAHDGLDFLAVWQMDQLAFANAAITFKFDYAKAAALGIDESALNVYKLVNGAWAALPGSVDSAANTITISTDSLGTFAVGVPEPATLVILGIGAALLRRKRSS